MTELVEREREVAQIERALCRSRSGSGSAVLIWGPAGIGKSSLLGYARSSALAAGTRVLRARGAELERDFGFGVVRQLFDPVLAAASSAERAEWLEDAAGDAARLVGLSGAIPPPAALVADPSFAILHGLYWLCAQLAATSPVCLTIDDAQWADMLSMRYVTYLLPRLEELPITVLLAVRSGGGPGTEVIAALAADPLIELVEPPPLSDLGVSQLLISRMPQPPDPVFVSRCYEVTGGIPFFVEHLARRFAADGIVPSASAAKRIEELGGYALSRSIRLRLARLGPLAVRLAQATAILESGEPALAARLAGLIPSEAASARDALVAAGVLAPGRSLTFVHAIVRRAVYDEMGDAERAAKHRQAAKLLAGAQSSSELVAEHLLATEPAGDAWVGEQLLQVANRAARTGAPESAATYLRRALSEPPSAGRRSTVLLELGRAEFNARQPEALVHLEEAVNATVDVRERITGAIILALCLSSSPNGVVDGLRVVDAAIASLNADDESLALALETWAADIMTLIPDLAAANQARILAARERARVIALPSREVLALAADIAVRSNEPAHFCADLAHRSLRAAPEPLIAALGMPQITVLPAAAALVFSEHYDEMWPLLDGAISEARSTGDVALLAGSLCFRARAWLNHGDLVSAETDAQIALRVGENTWFRVLAAALAVETLVECGRFDEAENQLAVVADDVDGSISTVAFLIMSRGRLRLAQLRSADALGDFLAAGSVAKRLGTDSPGWVPWRSCAALACLQLGDADQARQLAIDELGLARAFGAPRTEGIAIQIAGLATGGREGERLLREAISMLERGGAVLDRARAMCDLGAQLRRSNHRAESREFLRSALDVAHRTGAVPLADRAETELRATGARPRRAVLTGVAALTASERRVAELAADGLSNRQIAQTLFVTSRTIEGHLTSVFRKLDITSRDHLSGSLRT